jgi:predicted Zn-dependent peptidase
VSAAAPTDPAKVDRLVKRMNAMYAELAEKGVTEEELEVAKKQIAVSLKDQLRKPSDWVRRLANLTFYNRNLDDTVAAPAAYQAITAEQVQETFARYYSPESSVIVVVTPQ